MNNKKMMAGLLTAGLLLVPNTALAESTDVNLIVNDTHVVSSEAEGQVYINDAGRTMIPLRVVSETLDYETNWQPDGSIQITSADGTVDVTLQIGNTAYTANGETGTFATAPTLKNDRAYLPARDFTELYGSIYWDNDTRTVWISQGEGTDYQAIGTQLMRAQSGMIQQVEMPTGYVIDQSPSSDPIVLERTIDGVTYLGIKCNQQDISQPVPLFCDNGTSLDYVADVYGSSSFYINDNKLYSTDGSGAGGWSNAIDPNRLYVTDLETGQTAERTVDFVINDCTLNVVDGVLTATSPDGTQHVVALD